MKLLLLLPFIFCTNLYALEHHQRVKAQESYHCQGQDQHGRRYCVSLNHRGYWYYDFLYSADLRSYLSRFNTSLVQFDERYGGCRIFKNENPYYTHTFDNKKYSAKAFCRAPFHAFSIYHLDNSEIKAVYRFNKGGYYRIDYKTVILDCQIVKPDHRTPSPCRRSFP